VGAASTEALLDDLMRPIGAAKAAFRNRQHRVRSRTDETIENEGHRERPGDVSGRPGRADDVHDEG